MLYRLAREILWLAIMLAGAEKIFRRPLWPNRWRLGERLGWEWPEPSPQPCLWMHAASLGEAKGLWSLARMLADHPASFVLTVNTVTALEFLSRQIQSTEEPSRWRVVLAPLDHPRLIRKFLSHFRAQTLLLFEVELWPHFILTSRRMGKPVFWVSARLTPRARRHYALFPGAMRTLLRSVDWIQAQSDAEVEILRGWGAANVETGADLRGLHYLDAGGPELPAWSERRGVAFLSLHADEIPFVLPAIRALPDETVFVFPRKSKDIPCFQVALEGLGCELHSRQPDGSRLIVDSFGKVPEFLRRCHAAVIGGSFVQRGGHNLWEPLAAGVSMVIGPHYWNQTFLALRLAASGLLRIVDGALDPEILRKPDADPGPACREFVAREREALRSAVERVRGQLTLIP